jgi:tRNA-dihydrouridine synthase B
MKIEKDPQSTFPATAPLPLLHPMQIGGLCLENNLALAPMSGTTSLPFRLLCRSFGAGLVYTELVSARGISHDPGLRRNGRYLATDPAEQPLGIQLFGSEPDDFSRAIAIIGEHPLLAQCRLIDLNMGCPVPKVVRAGAGAALMRQPEQAARIVAASVRAAGRYGKPVTVKFRKGWDSGEINAVPFARLCEAAGADAIAVHGRTRDQMYGGTADWQIIGEVKAAVRIPVYGNGDVRDAGSAARMLRLTGADGCMVGRGALGRPWIFREIAAGLAALDAEAGHMPLTETPRPCLDLLPAEKSAVALRHLDGLIDLLGEVVAVREMRGQLVRYLKGEPVGSQLRKQAMQAVSRQDVQAVLDDWHRAREKSCENS